MDIPRIHPKALRPGDTIGIIAPAGPITSQESLGQGIAELQRIGFRVRFDDRIFESWRYLAGDDASRAAELMQYFCDPEIRGIISLRGGFGCSRLIPWLDEGRLRSQCKIFMGFSDLTTLHLYFRRRFGWVTIHGPMATSPVMAGLASTAQEDHLVRLWTDETYRPVLSFPQLETWRPGVGEAELAGGCLSLIVASLGTPYEVKTEGKILFLEDLGEPPYRIDRMLTQLRQAGKFNDAQGIILGSFRESEPPPVGYSLEETLMEVLGKVELPILAKFPAGHGPENWAIPLGVPVRLDAANRVIEFLEPAVRQ
jgi:muramoyltetrapeptide carboxypeptidase